MKKIILTLTAIFICTIARSDEITINWLNTDKTIDHTTTCTIGGDVILPQTPYKYGYTFNGWRANYIPIEYLESTGTQRMDTYYIPTVNLKIKTSVTHLSGTETGICCTVWSGRTPTLIFSSGVLRWHFGDNTEVPITSFTLLEIEASNGKLIVNGVNKTNTKQASISGSNTLKLFYNPGRIRMYYFQIYDNDVLVRDFIPVLDKDGVPCMFDKVEGKFYYNQGTGQFVAGPIIGE